MNTKPEHTEDLAFFRNLILAFANATADAGSDGPARARELASDYLRKLSDSGAGLEIEELLRAGCAKLPIAVILHFTTFLRRMPEAYSEIFGTPKRIARMVKEFESTALLFDGISRHSSYVEVSDWPLSEFVPSPHQMAEYLRYYQYINFIPKMFAFLKVRSTRDIVRYLPTAYVKAVTGDWHDREVSAIITAATGQMLDEAAHRVWRNRAFASITAPPDDVWQLFKLF